VIDPALFLRFVVRPGCGMAGAMMQARPDLASDEACVLLLAIALQESGLEHRRQVGADGQPMDDLARGWWQFEQGGGVKGVCDHPASHDAAEALCAALYVPFATSDVHEALAWNGPLAAAFARLLLWTDPAPLPAIGDEAGALDCYLRLWRPGKPHPEVWPANYALAVATVVG
jgi:hypothetical protein